MKLGVKAKYPSMIICIKPQKVNQNMSSFSSFVVFENNPALQKLVIENCDTKNNFKSTRYRDSEYY